MNISRKQTAIASCPDCAEKYHLGTQPKLDQKVACPNCRAHLIVISLNPLKLDWDIGIFREEEQGAEYWQEESW